jgi:dienelactone hydrolase
MRIVLALAAFAALAAGQDYPAQVRALRPASTGAMENALLDEIQQDARRALEAIPHARTRTEADRARPVLRRKLADALGYTRFPAADPRARTVGTLPRQGYRIEKVVWQTLPGVDVPAHLYMPDGLAAPAPAILFYPGHWWADSKTRPDFQAFCINMARLGFVVLTWDPFGQGERGQSARDHRRAESLLAGIAQQGIAEYETRRALEYLLGRKEVDPKRIGMTGASGGGYNTWITTALDDRIAVAVPVVGTSEFYEQIAATRPLDWYHANEHCHFVPGLIRFANNHELLAMAAPRPLMIISASQDQSFPVAGVREVARYGRELYAAHDAAGRFGYFEDASAGHGYQQKKREAAYGWFLKWLAGKGDGSPYPEPPTETAPFDAPELRCFPESRPAGPGIVAAVNRIAPRTSEPWPRIDTLACTAEVRNVPAQRLTLCGTPAFLIQPKQGREGGVVVALDDRGKEALASDPVVTEALARGWAVCGIDPRGIGERATTKMGWLAAVSLLLDDWFVRRQAADILTALRAFPKRTVALYARGDNAGLAAAVALNENPVQWFVLRDSFLGFPQFVTRPKSLELSYQLRSTDKDRLLPYDREIPFFYFPFRAWERTAIKAMFARSPGLIVNPINGDWERMDEPDTRALLPGSVQVRVTDAPGGAVREFLRARPVQ